MIILGAGFSRPAGLPLGDELFALLRRLAEQKGATFLETDIRGYQRYLRLAHGRRVRTDRINFEEFMAFLDIEHFLRLEGNDTWTNEGSKSQNLVRTLIAEILYSRQQEMTADRRRLYDSFVKRLDPSEWIMTFNYDTLLEDAMDRQKIPYRLVPLRLEQEADGSFVHDFRDEIVLLKMHGSIDWFDIKPFEDEKRSNSQQGLTLPSRHPIFGRNGLPRTKIVNEPYETESTLHRVFRVRNLERYLYNSDTIWPPLLIAPSFAKILYLNPLTEFWDDLGRSGGYHKRFVIIGFSLPSHDEYVRQAVFSLVRNYQHFDSGLPKSPLKAIDFRKTNKQQKEYLHNYQFVEWRRAEASFTGFDETVFDFIFGSVPTHC